MKTRISIVIPCRNEVKYIEECIHAIYASTSIDLNEINVYVVDGMSDDGTRDRVLNLCSSYPSLYLLDNPHKLTPFAFNIGLKQIKAEYYQIIGARHIISKNYLSRCVEVLSQDKHCWCVGGRLINEYTNSISEIISKAMSTKFGMGLGNFRTLEESCYTDTVTSPMYPAWVFDKIGYFDEELIRNQDDDFNFRVSKAGGKIWFEADINLKYYVRANFKGLWKQFFQYGYWKVYVNKKHGEVTTVRQLVPPLFVLYLITIPLIGLISLKLFVVYIVGLLFYKVLAVYFAYKQVNALKEFLGVLKTFPILHISYGLGYLNGILHFLILRKKPSHKQKTLSR
jgi:GT2 family glycosyltransferase